MVPYAWGEGVGVAGVPGPEVVGVAAGAAAPLMYPVWVLDGPGSGLSWASSSDSQNNAKSPLSLMVTCTCFLLSLAEDRRISAPWACLDGRWSSMLYVSVVEVVVMVFLGLGAMFLCVLCCRRSVVECGRSGSRFGPVETLASTLSTIMELLFLRVDRAS